MKSQRHLLALVCACAWPIALLCAHAGESKTTVWAYDGAKDAWEKSEPIPFWHVEPLDRPIRCLVAGPRDAVLTITQIQTLYRERAAVWEMSGERPALMAELPAECGTILSAVVDSQGGVWVGATDGLYVLHRGEDWRHVCRVAARVSAMKIHGIMMGTPSQEVTVHLRNITCLAQAKEGGIWAVSAEADTTHLLHISPQAASGGDGLEVTVGGWPGSAAGSSHDTRHVALAGARDGPVYSLCRDFRISRLHAEPGHVAEYRVTGDRYLGHQMLGHLPTAFVPTGNKTFCLAWRSHDNGGIIRIEDEQWRTDMGTERLGAGYVTCMAHDAAGRLYCGTYTEGVLMRDGTKWSVHPITEALTRVTPLRWRPAAWRRTNPRMAVTSVVCGEKGVLWVATAGPFLFRSEIHTEP